MKTRGKRSYALGMLLIFVLACGCCSAKKASVREKFQEWKNPGGTREQALAREQQALNHFSAAQLLARQGRGEEAVFELKAALRADPGSAYLREVLANLLFQMQKPEQALRYIEEAIEINPERASAYHLAGHIYLVLNKPDKAETAFRRAVELESDNEEYLSGLVQSLMAQQRPAEAVELLNQYAQNHPGDPEPFFLIGLIFQSLGQTEQALRNYSQVLKLSPSHLPALTNIFQLELERRNFEGALAAGRRLLEVYPEDSEARMMVVDLLFHLQRPEEALEVLEEGKKFGDSNAVWWIRKGYLLMFQGRQEEAGAEFEAALTTDPGSVEAVFALGMLEVRRGRWVEAASYFEAVPSDSELYVEARRQLALLALRQQEPERALSLMGEVYKKQATSPDVTAAYSSILREAGEVKKAERLVEAALLKNPQNETLLGERAMLYYVQNQSDAAIRLMEKMLEKNPENPQALNFIGYTYAEMGVNLDEAERMIRKALSLDPNAGYIMDSLGWVYYQRGNYEEALQWILKAAVIEGPDAEILEHVGDCYLALKDRKKAEEAYEKARRWCTSDRLRRRIEQKLEGMR